MSKGKFAPGKCVLLLRGTSDWARKYNGALATLEAVAPSTASGSPCWYLREVRDRVGDLRCKWQQKNMILIDPDETPEQSIEAMRRLHDTTAPAKEPVKAKAPDVVRPFKWEAL